jgi:hypothetical protein
LVLGEIPPTYALPQNPGPGYRFNTNTIYKLVNNTIIEPVFQLCNSLCLRTC